MRTNIWRYFDFWLFGAVAVLIIFGVAMIQSTVAGNIELLELDVVGRQILYAGAGFVLIILAASQDYRLWISISRLLYVLIAVLLLLILLTGGGGEGERFGAARWLTLGTVIFQPSELAKITIIVLLADFFARNRDKIGSLDWIARSAVLMVILVGLILLQPDLDTSIVLMVIWFSLLWATGLKLRHLLIFFLALEDVVAAPAGLEMGTDHIDIRGAVDLIGQIH